MAAIVVILLLLAANYQSFGLSISVPGYRPRGSAWGHAAPAGNRSDPEPAILYGTDHGRRRIGGQCDTHRHQCREAKAGIQRPFQSGHKAASVRMRPILMTSLAMIAGMIPMASGLGEAGDQSAPLGRAVIGGLAASTFAALFIVPLVYGWIRQKSSFNSCLLITRRFSQIKQYEITKFLILLLLSAWTYSSCSDKKDPDSKTTTTPSPHYELATVERKSVEQIVKLPAQLAAYQQVSIFPKVNGYVKTVLVDIGSHVRQGQLLMVLEAPELIQATAQARERYARAQADYTISKEDYERLDEASRTPGAISPMDLASAKAKMTADSALSNAEKANWQMQQTMLDYLQVTAPFSGVITQRNVHPGALVNAENKDIHHARAEGGGPLASPGGYSGNHGGYLEK